MIRIHATTWVRNLCLSVLLFTSVAYAQEELTLYTTREPGLIQPLLTAFTKETAIRVNTVYVKDGLVERLKSEGNKSRADVVMTVDVGQLEELKENGVTQALNARESATLNQGIAPFLRDRDNHWFPLSLRARVLYAEKNTPLKKIHYEELADPTWRGKICLRSGQHPYNTALIAAMLAHHGEAYTQKWLIGLKNNLARKPAGGDRDVARDILGGICDIGLANSYYVGHLKNSAKDSDARRWGEAITVIRPEFTGKNGGTHVNISGASIARYAPNREQAIRLMSFLLSKPAQNLYAQANYEHPVRTDVALDPTVAEYIGRLNLDTLPLADIARYRKQASLLVEQVGFDR